MEPWRKNPSVYEINTWVWLWELSREMGYPITLGNIPDEKWDELAHLNIEAVWLMGVWERSPMGIDISNRNAGNLSGFRNALPDFTLADNVGSPYCVRRYMVDEHLGGNTALAVARRQMARRGMKLILDFIPNHLAHDHPWITESPGYFIRGDKNDLNTDPDTFIQYGENIFACGKDPFYPAWQDVLQVNAFDPGLREAVIETVTRISSQCDGLRCDMAMLMINDVFERTWGKQAGPRPVYDYWEELIPAVKRSNPDFIFIAEVYWNLEWQLQQQGFDYCYDKRLYDILEHETAQDITRYLMSDESYQSKLIRFIENHDEPRHVVAFQKGKNRAAVVISSTLPGAKLYHEGQFEGRKIKLPVFLRRRPDEPSDTALYGFIRKLLTTIHRPVFKEGQWQLCECTGWNNNDTFRNLLAWCWFNEDDRYLVVVNYSELPAQGHIMLPGNTLAGSNWRLADAITDVSFERNGDEMQNPGLYVALGPWENHFLRFFKI
jgi:hypothetical protein